MTANMAIQLVEMLLHLVYCVRQRLQMSNAILVNTNAPRFNFLPVGFHRCKYALYPHSGTFVESDVVQQGIAFNSPLLCQLLPFCNLKEPIVPFFEVKGANNVVLDTIKQAEASSDLIVRMYESMGGRATFELHSSLPITSAFLVNLMEDEKSDGVLAWSDGKCVVHIKPFQVRNQLST